MCLLRAHRPFLLVVTLLFSERAFADELVARARAHFEAGRALYSEGKYQEAIAEYSLGYEMVPRAQFLLNLGQAYRKLNRLAKAKEMYEKYLAAAPVDDAYRDQVNRILLEIIDTLLQHPEYGAPDPVPDMTPAPIADAGVSSHIGNTTVEVVSPEPPKPVPVKPRFWKQHWWIIPVSGVVITAAVLGIYFGTRPDCGTLGCASSTPPMSSGGMH